MADLPAAPRAEAPEAGAGAAASAAAAPPPAPGPTVQHNRTFKEHTDAPPTLRALLAPLARAPSLAALRSIGVLRWWPTYTLAQLLGDAQAALTIAVILVPQGMAYALLAGLPPVYGLYTSTVPVVVYGLITSSAAVAPGPVAPTAIVMNAMVASLTAAAPLSGEFVRIHLALGFMTGVLQLGMALLQLTWVSDLVSYPVMNGFTFGAALVICASQLGDLFGLTVTRQTGFFNRVIAAAQAAGTGNWRTALTSLACLVVLLYYRSWRVRGWALPSRFPMPLVVIGVMTLVSYLADLRGSAGIALVGTIPSSLPPLTMPIAGAADVALVAGNAAILAVINYMQTVSLAKIFGRKMGEGTVPELEMVALGVSSVVASFMSAYTVAGSFTRTTVQFEAGARTPATTIITGLLMLVFLVSITRILNHLPMCVLAAIVLTSTRQLFATDVALELWRAKRADFAQMLVSMVAVLVLDIVYGLLVGVGFSIALILFRSFQPRLAELGNLPSTDVFVALSRFTEARPIPGLVILRLDGELHFGNMRRVTDRLRAMLEAAKGARAVALGGGGGGGAEAAAAAAAAASAAAAEAAAAAEQAQALSLRAAASAGGGGSAAAAPAESASAGLVGGLWQRLKGSSGGGGGGGSSSSSKSDSKERLVYALSKAPASLLSSLRDHKRRTSTYMPLPGSLQAGGGAAGAAAGLRQAESAVQSDDEGSSSSPPRAVAVGAAAAPAAAPAAAAQPPHSGPTLAIILDCSRVLEMDSTACKEVLAIIREFYCANARAAVVDREAGLASASASAAELPPPAPSSGAEPPPTELAAAAAAAAATATAASAAAATAATAAALASRKAEGLGAHTKLLLSSMPGPVRDTLDRFNRGELDLASTRFLSLTAAIAYLRELEEEKEEWGDVAEGLAALPLGDRELDGSLFFR